MNTEELIRVKRTIEGDHPLKHTPYNQIAAALSLALFIFAGWAGGWTGFLVTLAAWVVTLICLGVVSVRRALTKLTRQREEERREHAATLAGRRALATPDATYEERSAELAARFGRIEQTGPRFATPEVARRTKHASELVAEGVFRTTLRGFPVTVFDLEVANEADLGVLFGKAGFDRAFDLSTYYLTVCAVTLPFPLPHLSSTAAWSPGLLEDDDVPAELRHTDDPAFASLMLSVPDVRKVAHNLNLPWTVSGDVLTTSVLTPSGLDAPDVLRMASSLTGLAERFPWDRLEACRSDTAVLPAPWPAHRSPLLARKWWDTENFFGHPVLQWFHHPLGDGVHAFRSTPIYLGEPR
ncbi:MAG TPA: hypothetical protein VF821_10595 [Lentzea sp.]